MDFFSSSYFIPPFFHLFQLSLFIDDWLLFPIKYSRFSITSSSFIGDWFLFYLIILLYKYLISSFLLFIYISLHLIFYTYSQAKIILFYYPNQLFFTSTLPDSDPLGTFLNLNFGAPHGGHLYDLSSSFAHAAGPFVYT